MKTERTINLTAYTVEYIDPREEKPRTVRTDTYILDGGRINALRRLGIKPGGYIVQQFERCTGYAVATVRKGESLTASVDLAALWQQATEQTQMNAQEAAQQ